MLNGHDIMRMIHEKQEGVHRGTDIIPHTMYGDHVGGFKEYINCDIIARYPGVAIWSYPATTCARFMPLDLRATERGYSAIAEALEELPKCLDRERQQLAENVTIRWKLEDKYQGFLDEVLSGDYNRQFLKQVKVLKEELGWFDMRQVWDDMIWSMRANDKVKIEGFKVTIKEWIYTPLQVLHLMMPALVMNGSDIMWCNCDCEVIEWMSGLCAFRAYCEECHCVVEVTTATDIHTRRRIAQVNAGGDCE